MTINNHDNTANIDNTSYNTNDITSNANHTTKIDIIIHNHNNNNNKTTNR